MSLSSGQNFCLTSRRSNNQTFPKSKCWGWCRFICCAPLCCHLKFQIPIVTLMLPPLQLHLSSVSLIIDVKFFPQPELHNTTKTLLLFFFLHFCTWKDWMFCCPDKKINNPTWSFLPVSVSLSPALLSVKSTNQPMISANSNEKSDEIPLNRVVDVLFLFWCCNVSGPVC